MNWLAIRAGAAGLQRARRAGRLRAAAAAGVAAANPRHGGVTPDSSFNTAVSFVTNTNWQGYAGEVDHELSHADARAGGAELPLGRDRHRRGVRADPRLRSAQRRRTIGNFWVDLTRITLYVLLPLSLVLALVLVSQGVIQNFDAYKEVTTLEPRPTAAEGRCAAAGMDAQGTPSGDVTPTQTLADGPGRLAGSDQGARHQRRRLLQRQLRASIREPDGADQFPADAGDLPDPGGAVLHVRPHGRRHAPGLGVLCGDDADVLSRWSGRHVRPNSSGNPLLRRWASTRRQRHCSPAATWKARRRASASSPRPVRG